MEIRNYVRQKRRWIAPLVAVPLLAGGATASYLASLPPEFTATVQIQAPASVSNSDAQIGLYSEKLAQAIKLPDLIQNASNRSGIGVEDLFNDATLDRLASSDQMTLTLTTRAPDQANLDAAKSLAQDGIRRLVERSGGDPQAGVNTAEKVLADAQDALAQFETQNGIALAPTVSGGIEASQLRTMPVELRQELNIRQARVTAATSQLADAQKEVSQLQSRLEIANSGSQLVQAIVVPEPTIRPVVEGSGFAFGVAFLAILGFSVLPDLLRRRPAAWTTAGQAALGPDSGSGVDVAPAPVTPDVPASDPPPSRAAAAPPTPSSGTSTPLVGSSSPIQEGLTDGIDGTRFADADPPTERILAVNHGRS